tara:strand:+ start:395 stop:670 length:276 start_codon:yes stop_codon:yes gene_type:complete
MRALYLESLRTLLNTMICILIARAGIELNSDPLVWIAGLMWFSKIIAMMERRTTWRATKKKPTYRREFPKLNNAFTITDMDISNDLDNGRD